MRGRMDVDATAQTIRSTVEAGHVTIRSSGSACTDAGDEIGNPHRTFPSQLWARSSENLLVDMEGQRVARRRALLAIGAIAIPFVLFHGSAWQPDSVARQTIVWIGTVLIALAIAGRIWVACHIGHRKRWQFVCDGPYSLACHPLYSLSVLGAAGLGAQTTSITIMLAAAVAVSIVLARMALIEEADMTARFGESYRTYRACTPRFLPRLSLWRASDQFSTRLPHASTYTHASFFALAIPARMALDWMHGAGVLPILFSLP